jgi:hypothetical protein
MFIPDAALTMLFLTKSEMNKGLLVIATILCVGSAWLAIKAPKGGISRLIFAAACLMAPSMWVPTTISRFIDAHVYTGLTLLAWEATILAFVVFLVAVGVRLYERWRASRSLACE